MADRSSGGTTWPSPDQRRALPKPDQARKGRPRPFEANRFRRHREGSQVAERYSRRSRVAAYRATNRSLKSARRQWRPLRKSAVIQVAIIKPRFETEGRIAKKRRFARRS